MVRELGELGGVGSLFFFHLPQAESRREFREGAHSLLTSEWAWG
jgi:hypothetical protein